MSELKIEGNTLREKLESFQEWTEKEETIALSTEKFETELQEKFKELAKAFLYGGYIKVFAQNDKGGVDEFYRIYIRTVEFYFHCEEKSPYNPEGSPLKITDPIVYHRNNSKYFKGKVVPYFPIMTLHAHDIGYDITFENKTLQYRASALIREYSIKENNNFLKLESNKSKNENKDHTPDTRPWSFSREDKVEDECSNKIQLLYNYLNGFSLNRENRIEWVDEPETPANVGKGEPRVKGKPRVRVYEYKPIDEKGNYNKK